MERMLRYVSGLDFKDIILYFCDEFNVLVFRLWVDTSKKK